MGAPRHAQSTRTILKGQESKRFRESWPHVGPTHCLCGSHILFRWDPYGTHILFRRDPRAIQAGPTWDPRAIQTGPTRYSDGTHVLFRRAHVGPTVLLSDPFYLKKIFPFHYLTIQNIFNYFLHIKIITKLCILHSHVVVLLLFGFGFPSVNSQNILELFVHF